MSPFWNYIQLRWGLALAILVLVATGGWSYADESEVRFLLSEPLETETFQEMSLQAEEQAALSSSDGAVTQAAYSGRSTSGGSSRRMGGVRVGYDHGFLIASQRQIDLGVCHTPFLMRVNGWGQMRHAALHSKGENPDVNQFQLKRARLIFSGSAFTPDFTYFVQLDGRSSSGDDMRLLDYVMTYDIGHHALDLGEESIVFKTGKYKIPFSMARYLSGREFEFTDRSVASMFFDANRSLAWGLYGECETSRTPVDWEVAVFNGLVTGGAETGSSGSLDNNFAYSARFFVYPNSEWGEGELADFDWHETIATRMGAAFANTTIEEEGETEFEGVRVVDSGLPLAMILPPAADQYSVDLMSVDFSCKLQGWSLTFEQYFRRIYDVQGAAVPNMYDQGFWFQLGKFVVPRRVELLMRWSRVQGNSGTLGLEDQSAEEIAAGFAWYLRDQHAKLTFDATYLDGAPISSSALDIQPGDIGWLLRSQIQFAF